MNETQAHRSGPAAPAPGASALRHAAPGPSARRRALYAATMLAPLAAGLILTGRVAAQPQPGGPTAEEAQPLSAGAAAQPAPAAEAPAAAPAPAETALSVLLEQANYWRSQQRLDQAIASLVRAQKLAPDNPDLLALTAQVQNEAGNRQAAAAALAKLRQVAPNDPRVATIDQGMRVGTIPQETLTEARRLAQSGKQADAVDRYNRAFKGNAPPDAFAIEYYQTLAGTEAGWPTARDALAKLVRQSPNDLHTQLVYAQVLTYREPGRLEGIKRLEALAQNPEVAEQATQSWRQALGWLPDNKDATDPLNSYLALHPDDSTISAKLAAARNPLLKASPAERARIEGFAALDKGKLGDAATQFQQAIDTDANDADATGGLGLVKLRQGKFADAKTLLGHAIALDPEHKGRWQAALAAAANPGGGPNPAVALINHGDFAGAQRELEHQIARGGDVAGLQVMLADAQARQGKLDEAEASYRAALARAPNNPQGLVGLAGVLSRQGRAQEASDLLDRAQATGNSKLVGQARALQLREQANAITDPATQEGLYRAAIAADPDNPWLRLDFARTLVKRGQVPQARSAMADVIDNHPSSDALRAGIIFANETSDPDAAATLVARLPPTLRTPEMRSLQAQADLQRQIGAALVLPAEQARQRLLALAAAADPDGARGAATARALSEIGAKASAREAIVAAQASTPGQGPAARLRYAGALLDIGEAAAASSMLAQVGAGAGLTPQQRQDMIQMQAGLAVRNSDQLNEKGKQAEAYDQLAPLLAQAPQNPDLNLALARLYQGAHNPREALQISEGLLHRDPGNLEARRGAVSAALALGDRARADALVQEGLQRTPNDPKVWMMSADVARAGGNNGRALRDLQRARDLRLQQLGYAGGQTATATLPDASLRPGAVPIFPPAAPAPTSRQTPLSTTADAGSDGGADLGSDGGADQPTDLSQPPVLRSPPPVLRQPVEAPDVQSPFAPQRVSAVGTAPTYQPQGTFAQSRLPDASADQLNLQQLGHAPDPAIFGRTPPPPAVFQPPVQSPPAAQFAQSQGYYNNPFRVAPGAGQSDPTAIPAVAGAAAADPETAEIERSIMALRDTVAPSVQAGFGFRSRSGDSGLDQLTELTTPMEATFSPGGRGQLKLTVTPTLLSAGTLGGTASNQQRFGTNALALSTSSATSLTTLNGPGPGDQNAQGVALDVGYTVGSFSGDVGTTPLGFREQNVLGGVEWAPALTDHVRLRLTAERRALDDSLLSYAGVVDPRTGTKWGGVTRNHGRANLEFTAGQAQFYVGGGGQALNGTHVASNTETEFGAGGSFPVWKTPTQEVRVGLDLVYFAYQKNLRYFTLGQGGYFSPQSYAAALIPVSYKEQIDDDLSYEIGGAAGIQSYHENSSNYYPSDPQLQAQLVAQQDNPNTAASGVLTQYPGQSKAGFSGNAHASLEYRVSPSLHVGGRVGYEHSGNFDDASGVVFARYLFNGAEN